MVRGKSLLPFKTAGKTFCLSYAILNSHRSDNLYVQKHEAPTCSPRDIQSNVFYPACWEFETSMNNDDDDVDDNNDCGDDDDNDGDVVVVVVVVEEEEEEDEVEEEEGEEEEDEKEQFSSWILGPDNCTQHERGGIAVRRW